MYRMSSPLERFEVGDEGCYLQDQRMYGDYPNAIKMDEVTQKEAEELASGAGVELNNNKQFVCVKKTDEKIVFVYWHDFRYEVRTYRMVA